MNIIRRDNVLAVLRSHKKDFAERYGVTTLGIFGSVARVESNEESDVDIVFTSDAPNLFRRVRLKQELETLLGRRVDLVRLREDMDPKLRSRIVREAQYA